MIDAMFIADVVPDSPAFSIAVVVWVAVGGALAVGILGAVLTARTLIRKAANVAAMRAEFIAHTQRREDVVRDVARIAATGAADDEAARQRLVEQLAIAEANRDFAREGFNFAAHDYHSAISRFPGSILAAAMGLQPVDFNEMTRP